MLATEVTNSVKYDGAQPLIVTADVLTDETSPGTSKFYFPVELSIA